MSAGTRTIRRVGFGERGKVGDDDKAYRTLFSPEFRNRLDGIIQFKSLGTDVIKTVVDKFLTELQSQLDEKRVQINVDEAARARLEAQTRAEAQAKAKADAQRQTQMAGETSQYLAEVKARVEHAWNRPASAKKGVQCTLEVDQAPTGTVLQARVINPCNGDEAVRASIRDAALRASPLPVPQNRDLFQRTLHLVFSPDD